MASQCAGHHRAHATPALSSARRVGAGVAVAATLLVSACAVGPNFKTPSPPQVSSYTPSPPSPTFAVPGTEAGETQRLVSSADLPGDWWTLFHSTALNALVEQSLAHNHDLKAAQAALTVARETALAQRGVYFPSVSASYSASRQKQSNALAPTPDNNAFEFSLFTPELSVSYVLDVFGLNRRTVEAAKAQADAARFQMIAAHLTLTTNVANAAIQDASLSAQIDATRELIDISSKSVEILKYQLSKGYANGLDLAAQEAQLAQVTASLPPLVKQESQERDLIAVLAGRYPSQAPSEKVDLAALTLPSDLPLSLPSSLVAQRPDVLQAQANLHVASAQVGVAEANRLPNFQLTANTGGTALSAAEVFASGNTFWAFGAAATAPIFQGGTLLHQERAAKAAYVQAAEQYKSTVLQSFQNVADTLGAIDQDAQALKASGAAAGAAKTTLDLAQRQYRSGYASYLSLLSAEQAYQQARIALVQAQAARYSDTVALYQALGRGWWRRADLAKDHNAN